MASIRQDKIAKVIQQEMAIIFQQNAKELFGGAFITVTAVRMTVDMGMAKVYLSIFTKTTEEKEVMLEHVRKRKGQIRGLLGHKVGKQLRAVPELSFYIDDSLDYLDEIDNLLKK